MNQNATAPTSGNFTLSLTESAPTHTMNWTVIGLGAVVTLSGGVVATAFWGTKPRTRGVQVRNSGGGVSNGK